MAEFDLIRQLQQRICAADAPWRSSCRVGIGDDAAVLESPAGRQFVVCTDSLVQAVHFPVDTPAAAVGHKALAVNLSDLATSRHEGVKTFDLRETESTLHVGNTVIETQFLLLIIPWAFIAGKFAGVLGDAMGSQQTKLFIEFRIVGGDHPTLAGGHMLHRVERENGHVTMSTRS